MRYSVLKGCLIALFSVISVTVFAQDEAPTNQPITQAQPQPKSRYYIKNSASKVTSEFGLGVGARYNFFDVVPLSNKFNSKVTMNFSYGAALQFRLNLGSTFGIQPEIVYAYSTIKFRGGDIKSAIKAKSNLVQIPLLFSFRIAMLRLNFGPVLTVMDNPTYQLIQNNEIQQMPLGKIFPTVTYAAGISIKLPKNSIIDVRYADQFKDIATENEFYWTLDRNEQSDPLKFRTRCRSVQVRWGLVF